MTEESDRLALLVVPSCPWVVKDGGTQTSVPLDRRKCVFASLFMNRMNEQSVQMLDEGLTSRKVDGLIDALDSGCLGNETPSSRPYLNICPIFWLLIGNDVGFLCLLSYLTLIAIITCSARLMTAGMATALMDVLVLKKQRSY